MDINILLALFFFAAGIYQFWVLPLWLLPADPLWGLSLIPLALLTNTYWALLHDTFHGSFCRSARLNVVVGRSLSILFGSPFHLLRLGHVLHHGFNRTARERIEVYDDTLTTRWRAAPSYYLQLLGGLYLQEFAASVLFLLPKRVILNWFMSGSEPKTSLSIMAKKLTAHDMLPPLRIDSLFILTVFGSAAWAYGEYLWMLLLAWGARAFLISFADYVYHYETPLNDVLSGRNLRLPKLLSTFLLHFNMHGAHHLYPQLGWRQLPEAFDRMKVEYDSPMLPALLRQLHGPVPLSRLDSSPCQPVSPPVAV